MPLKELSAKADTMMADQMSNLNQNNLGQDGSEGADEWDIPAFLRQSKN